MRPIDNMAYICHNAIMKRTMIYLPDELSKRLKHLAVERDTSVAELIREAASALVDEDREDMLAVREVLAEYRADPASAVPLADYRRSLKKR